MKKKGLTQSISINNDEVTIESNSTIQCEKNEVLKFDEKNLMTSLRFAKIESAMRNYTVKRLLMLLERITHNSKCDNVDGSIANGIRRRII